MRLLLRTQARKLRGKEWSKMKPPPTGKMLRKRVLEKNLRKNLMMMTAGKTTESSSSREMGSRMFPRTQLRKK